MTYDNLFNITNEEAVEWFRATLKVEPDPEYKRRLKEYYQNIERDFQEEWAKKKCKWFFTKYRQKKLKYKIYLRYESPLFWLIEDTIEEILPQACRTNNFFNNFVEIKNIASDEENTK